jgi:hypothetical protein
MQAPQKGDGDGDGALGCAMVISLVVVAAVLLWMHYS